MNKSLVDITCFSEKRKNLLLLLMGGDCSIDEIKKKLDETSTSILPQIKILKESGLVIQGDEFYSLSPLGKLIIENIKPVLTTLEILDTHYEYLNEHDLSAVPGHLLDRIGELQGCTVIEPSLVDTFQPNKHIMDDLIRSEDIVTFVSVYHPAFPSIYAELAQKGVHISLVMTPRSFNRQSEEFPMETETLIRQDNSEISVYRDAPMPAILVVTDRILYLSLLDRQRSYEHRSLICNEPEAIRWGYELFDWYRQRSEPVTDVGGMDPANEG
ncbi:MAG: winged helix-turn-helix domain-containing protein [Euryarchaeota archaeon]|nr:winged helix-turn-helix domain-containing protein [Euryarchaeota archaeon]